MCLYMNRQHTYNLRSSGSKDNTINGDPSDEDRASNKGDEDTASHKENGTTTDARNPIDEVRASHKKNGATTDADTGGNLAKIKAGDMAWIPKLRPNVIFRNWVFHFRNLAELHLSPIVYPNESQRNNAWITALYHAALESNNNVIMDLIMGMRNNRVLGPDMLERIEAHYCNWDEADKKAAKNALFKYGGEKTFRDSLIGLQRRIEACRRLGYFPPDDIIGDLYEGIIPDQHYAMAIMHLKMAKKQSRQGESIEIFAHRTLLLVAQMVEDRRIKATESETMAHFGATATDRGKGPRRLGYDGGNGQKDTRSTKGNTSRDKQRYPCNRCGTLTCKFFSTGKAADCVAWGKECTACGLKNHFARACRKTKLASLADTREVNGEELSGEATELNSF